MRGHSYRNASIGSNIDALRAGYNPKNTPTAAANKNPPTTDTGEITVGQLASIDSTFDATIPKTAPASPPMMLSSADSTRNCSRSSRMVVAPSSIPRREPDWWELSSKQLFCSEVGQRICITYWTGSPAAAQERDGAIDDAMQSAEQALQANPDERAYLPEILRLRGELQLKQGPVELAEADFREATALAHNSA